MQIVRSELKVFLIPYKLAYFQAKTIVSPNITNFQNISKNARGKN